MDHILFLAGLVNRADRVLESIEIEGIECFGVEVSANKYGDNSPDDKHRMWFDAETKLPVRMEFEYWQSDGKTRSIRIRNQFQWDPELPPDTFVPEIPKGFSLISDYERLP
jgi:outer membrane lipoprotein-sorting protein